MIKPEELHDFYNHSSVKGFKYAGRHLEVFDEPKELFKEDQMKIDPKVHII